MDFGLLFSDWSGRFVYFGLDLLRDLCLFGLLACDVFGGFCGLGLGVVWLFGLLFSFGVWCFF